MPLFIDELEPPDRGRRKLGLGIGDETYYQLVNHSLQLQSLARGIIQFFPSTCAHKTAYPSG